MQSIDVISFVDKQMFPISHVDEQKFIVYQTIVDSNLHNALYTI